MLYGSQITTTIFWCSQRTRKLGGQIYYLEHSRQTLAIPIRMMILVGFGPLPILRSVSPADSVVLNSPGPDLAITYMRSKHLPVENSFLREVDAGQRLPKNTVNYAWTIAFGSVEQAITFLALKFSCQRFSKESLLLQSGSVPT